MIKNYLKIAWRNLLRNKVSALINIGGLAVGMAVAMLIGLWIWDEFSFNKYHQNYDRIAQVSTALQVPKELMAAAKITNSISINQTMQYPLVTVLKTSYKNNFKHIVVSSWDCDDILTAGDKNLSRTGVFMDPDAPDMLTLKMVYGSRSGLSRQPNSIMLSESTAKAFFGNTDPVNQLMKINNKTLVKVMGVYEDLPLNGKFKDLKFLAPFGLWVADNPWAAKSINDWQDHFLKIYVEINPNTTFEKVSNNIKNAELNNLVNLPEEVKMHPQVFLLPMADWHLHGYERGRPNTAPLQMLWQIGIIGTFVLLLACINFMNLSTARSEKRAKEIGVRKTMGSMRVQLIGQFFSESFLVVVLSFLLSLLLVFVSITWFNNLAGKQLQLPYQSLYFWLTGVVFIFITGLLAGSYPALYLSSFNPVKVLKGTFKVGRLASIPRKVLVVTQFTVSVALIICTVLIYRQVQVAKNRPVGYTREGLLMIQKKSDDFSGKYELLRTELKNTGAVAEMSESLGKVTEIASGNGGFQWRGKNPDPKADDQFGTLPVTFEFGKTVGWQFVRGRDFSRDFPTDSSGMVINESAAEKMGLKNPVGEAVSWKFQDQPVKYYKILGVVKDMVMESPYAPTSATVFMVKGHVGTDYINIKINPDVSMSQALPKIASVFKKLIPSAPFEYKFADEDYALKFADEERIGTIAGFFGVLAVFISCLGLFGLAAFIAEQRIKEIGVRKILGASVFNLWALLSKDFVRLVIISLFIASPIAYWFMHSWLQKYQYRTDLSWWIFAATGLGALTLTLLTVSYQSLRAALTNPARSLKTE